MYTDREEFEGWMERIMERFDRTEKLLERVLKKNNTLDGEEVLDNQDLCLLLKVGIRTLLQLLRRFPAKATISSRHAISPAISRRFSGASSFPFIPPPPFPRTCIVYHTRHRIQSVYGHFLKFPKKSSAVSLDVSAGKKVDVQIKRKMRATFRGPQGIF